jgi:hypothetical protein
MLVAHPAGKRVVGKRATHALVVNTALVVVSLFYLFAPPVYAYFSEVGMSYSDVPRWFAATPPAWITARLFDRYNVHAPRAVNFRRHLSCYLHDDGGSSECAHELTPGRTVRGPESLRVSSGWYEVRFGFSENAGCSSGDVRLQVATTGRFGRVLRERVGRIDPSSRVEMLFHLTDIDAALAALEFRATGVSGCVILSSVDWTELPLITQGPIWSGARWRAIRAMNLGW